MRIFFKFLTNLFKSLSGGKKGAQKKLSPTRKTPSNVETKKEEPPGPPDVPEEVFDDPKYDVENITEDDDTERDELEKDEEPDQEILDKVEAEMLPLDSWKERQQGLKDLGHYGGKIDGIPGRKTSAAMRKAEKALGLEVDGEWDLELYKKVVAALKKQSKPVIKSPLFATPPSSGYEDMIDESEYELDDAFFSCFIDLTPKSNVKTKKGFRRKGVRKFSKLTRFCWHQTAFVWRPYLESKKLKKYTTHHRMNAHMLFDSDGTVFLLHNFKFYLWTANAFNSDCISIEILGNFEGIQGSGKWYKGDKFGRARPTREQLIRCRQFTKWMLDPEQGPEDDKLLKPLLEWREGCRKYGNPLTMVNTHRESTHNRNGDCGSETWYHIGEWSMAKTSLTHGPKKGKGKDLPAVWSKKPPAPPLPPAK